MPIPLTRQTNNFSSEPVRNSLPNNGHFIDYIASLKKQYGIDNKVLLIQTPQFLFPSFNHDVAKNKGCYAYPPTGLQCLTKVLDPRGANVAILDLNFLLLERAVQNKEVTPQIYLDILDDFLAKNDFSIVGVTSLTPYTDVFKDHHPLTCVLEYLKNKNKFIVIAGGTIPTNEYKNYLIKNLCHFVVTGEGEDKLRFLYDYLVSAENKSFITRGVFFNFQSTICETKGIERAVPLAGNIIETYKYISIERYHAVGSLNPFSRMVGQDKKFSGIQFVRGCRADCKFCGVNDFMGKGVRQYPVTEVLNEMVYLITEKGIRHFELLDDDFLASPNSEEDIIALLEGMVKFHEQFDTSWSAGNGLIAVSLNEKILSLIQDSGCCGFRIGIESGDAKMLRRIKKPASLTTLRNFGRIIQKFQKLFVGGNYILGLFGEETFEQMLNTYLFARDINLDWAAYSTFQPTHASLIETSSSTQERITATEFIPSKDHLSRNIHRNTTVVPAHKIFSLPKESIPSREQIKEIWFAFNLLSNYIDNKNLKPGGNIEKFISWLKAIRIGYPENPYMDLFIALGYAALERLDSAQPYLEMTKIKLGKFKYWQERFFDFNLISLIEKFPRNHSQVIHSLEAVKCHSMDHRGNE